MNMCLLDIAMCEKCRSSDFQLEGGVKSLRTGVGGVTNLEGLLLLWSQYTIICYVYANMQRMHQKVLGTTFKRPTLHGTIK